MSAAGYLETWRDDQQEDRELPTDIRMTIWLSELTRDQVLIDQAGHMQPAEIALMRRHERRTR